MATTAMTTDWTIAPLGELIDHILDAHHVYLRREMPRLNGLLNQVAAVHPENIELREIFDDLRAELENHMMKEEMVLFPHIRRMAQAAEAKVPAPRAPFGSVTAPIRMMESEHAAADAALDRLRELTGGYRAPSDSCSTFRATMEALEALDADLHRHIHLENDILFPRAYALER